MKPISFLLPIATLYFNWKSFEFIAYFLRVSISEIHMLLSLQIFSLSQPVVLSHTARAYQLYFTVQSFDSWLYEDFFPPSDLLWVKRSREVYIKLVPSRILSLQVPLFWLAVLGGLSAWKKVVCVPIVSESQKLKSFIGEKKEMLRECNWLGCSPDVCQQLHLYEGMRTQETNAKQKQQQIRGGFFILEANACVLCTALSYRSMCYCGNALVTDHIWLANSDLTKWRKHKHDQKTSSRVLI